MSVLDQILAVKRDEVQRARSQTSEASLLSRATEVESPRGFLAALIKAEKPGLIAEVKKASPSQGVIRPNFDPELIADAYREAGATALSVLTDEVFFQGHSSYIEKARRVSGLPALRKDFMLDPYQVVEARAWGADAILLIVAALERNLLEEMLHAATDLGMDALVEIHDERESDIALEAGATLIGINNRNLADFKTDLETTERLCPRLGNHAFIVSESALERNEDVERVAKAGASAVLIGTTFCKSPDIASKVREVMGW